jgi:hypothetical protein
MNNWKPIETAPKDGTMIDLWYEFGGRIANAQWIAGTWQTRIWDGTLRVVSIEKPTHWMDIPEGPKL